MMATEKHYTRLGFFVVAGLVVAIATGLFFVERMRRRAVFEVVTYTTEDVSGLDVSSPVRFRGVPVGRVSGIRVDPVGSAIEIDFDVFRDRLVEVGARFDRVENLAVYPKLRAQIIGNPVTGEAYLLIDLLSNPPPAMALGFKPSRTYVPSMPSPMSALRDRLPEVLDRMEQTLRTLRDIVARVPDSLDRSDRFFTNVERIMRESELPQLSASARTFFTTTSAQIGHATTDLEKALGASGSLATLADEARVALKDADLPGSTEAAREALDRTSAAADELRRSLPAIRESLAQLRDLARRLDEQPESVVYGPRRPGGKQP
jgi:hypothetical protein